MRHFEFDFNLIDHHIQNFNANEYCVHRQPGKHIKLKNGKSCLNMATFNFLGMVGNKEIEVSFIITLILIHFKKILTNLDLYHFPSFSWTLICVICIIFPVSHEYWFVSFPHFLMNIDLHYLYHLPQFLMNLDLRDLYHFPSFS